MPHVARTSVPIFRHPPDFNVFKSCGFQQYDLKELGFLLYHEILSASESFDRYAFRASLGRRSLLSHEFAGIERGTTDISYACQRAGTRGAWHPIQPANEGTHVVQVRPALR